jgi:hypothetical protein
MRLWKPRWHFGGFLFSCAVATSILIIYVEQSPISKANFKSIKEGMTDAEVKKMLGQPSVLEYALDGREGIGCWNGSGGAEILVLFDSRHRVISKEFRCPTTWEKIQRLLGIGPALKP